MLMTPQRQTLQYIRQNPGCRIVQLHEKLFNGKRLWNSTYRAVHHYVRKGFVVYGPDDKGGQRGLYIKGEQPMNKVERSDLIALATLTKWTATGSLRPCLTKSQALRMPPVGRLFLQLVEEPQTLEALRLLARAGTIQPAREAACLWLRKLVGDEAL